MTKFTGIQHANRVGFYSVDDNARILNRFRFIHESLMRTAAAHLPAREHWDLKMGLARSIYEDAEAADALRKRVVELRVPPAKLNREPDAMLAFLFEELIHAANDLELTVAVYGIIKPALLQAYKNHIETTQPIVDQPTIRLLRTAMIDLTEQIAWGEELAAKLQASLEYPLGTVEFAEKMQAFMSACGNLDGSGSSADSLPLRWRSVEPYRLPKKAVRHPKLMGPTTIADTGVDNPPEDETLRYLYSMMRWRQNEMSAVELLAAIIYTQSQMPWEFFHEAARHLWDEARHSMFGQVALENEGIDWMPLPQDTSGYDLFSEKINAAKYIWLTIGVEESLMKYPGKKGEYEFCRDKANHLLMTQFQDYDWADEVIHAQFGRKWAVELTGESIARVRQLANEEVREFDEQTSKANERWNKEKILTST